MDAKYNRITTNLKTKYAEAPVIIEMWQYYLRVKKQKFIESLEQCEQMLNQLDQIDNIRSFDSKTLLMLYIMNKYMVIT